MTGMRPRKGHGPEGRDLKGGEPAARAAAGSLSEHQALSQIGQIRTIPERLAHDADPLVVGARSAEVLGAIVRHCFEMLARRSPALALPAAGRRRLKATSRVLEGLADLGSIASTEEAPVIARMVSETMTMQAAASFRASAAAPGGATKRSP